MSSWGELEKDTGLGLFGLREKLEALEIEHSGCAGVTRRLKAEVVDLQAQLQVCRCDVSAAARSTQRLRQPWAPLWQCGT